MLAGGGGLILRSHEGERLLAPPLPPWERVLGGEGLPLGVCDGRGRLTQARLPTSRPCSSSFRSTAARLSASCSGLLAPMIAEVIPGWASTQATATLTRDLPRASRCCFNC